MTGLARTLTLGVALVILVPGCGSDSTRVETPETGSVATTPSGADPGSAAGLPLVDPLDVTGDITVAGSSTVFPLTEALAARFENEGFGGQITIDSIGSGAGFERFCVEGESDISNASRPIKDGEIAACQTIGRDPIELRLGTDALAVTVSPGNTFATDITLEELAVLFSTAATWQDVRPDWPANPIARFIPGTDSGTFDYFVEEVFDGQQSAILAADAQKSEDDNFLVTGISGDGCDAADASTTCAVGFFGYAYYEQNRDQVKVLSVNGVAAAADTVGAGQYPLSRPLFMYTTASIMAEKPQVGAFLNFVLTHVDEEIGTVGYFPAPDADLEAAKQVLAAALNG